MTRKSMAKSPEKTTEKDEDELIRKLIQFKDQKRKEQEK